MFVSFVIFINDLPSNPVYSDALLYADDSKLFVKVNSEAGENGGCGKTRRNSEPDATTVYSRSTFSSIALPRCVREINYERSTRTTNSFATAWKTYRLGNLSNYSRKCTADRTFRTTLFSVTFYSGTIITESVFDGSVILIHGQKRTLSSWSLFRW